MKKHFVGRSLNSWENEGYTGSYKKYDSVGIVA